ncbi:MAG: DsbA family protein [Candidatus Magasanikbacteria bacterium]
MEAGSISPNPKKSWHHTTAGIIFIAILSVLLFAGLAFGSLVGYYAWKIKTGNTELLAEFQQASDSLSATSLERIDNPESLIDPFNPTTGPKNAKVTIIMFKDFLCTYCQEAYPVFKKIQQQYGEAVRVVFKHFPIESIHPGTTQVSIAAACAHEQGKFWEYYDQIFTQKAFAQSDLHTYAQELNLDLNKFGSCLLSERHETTINQDLTDGLKAKIQGTPTYIVNDLKVEGVLTQQQWNTLILEELAHN